MSITSEALSRCIVFVTLMAKTASVSFGAYMTEVAKNNSQP